MIGAAIAKKLASQGYTIAVNHSGEHSAEGAKLAFELTELYGVEAKKRHFRLTFQNLMSQRADQEH